MRNESPSLLGRLFFIIWPVVLIAGTLYGVRDFVLKEGLPGIIQMPLVPATTMGGSAVLGLRGSTGTIAGVTVIDPVSPRIGIGPFSQSNQPEFDLDVLSDTVRFTARSAEGAVQFHLPKDAEIVLNGKNPVSLSKLIDSIQNQSTVGNVMAQVDDLDKQISAVNDSLKIVATATNEADKKADKAQQSADSAAQRAIKANGLAQQGIGSAAKAQQMALAGQDLAKRAQATADKATGLANAGQQSANQAMNSANKGIKNSLALKKYIDHRSLEIQNSLNGHYRANRPGGKELNFQKITASRGGE